MGKPTGFLEYQRQLAADRDVDARLRDWEEIHEHLTVDELRTQGARCMDCGLPFCHTGLIINGAASGCPINNLIPEWNDLVYRGLWRQAVERLLKTNNFPEFTGRVCPAPCEGACVLGMKKPAVTIKQLECAIVDHAFDAGWIAADTPRVRTGKSVAVVGSGPAGLACADQLNKAGHTVTVFERADRPGGLLMYGIPNMKLDKGIVQRRLDLLAAAGVTFRVNTEVGVDYPAAALRTEFDAAVLCGGASKPRDLAAPGRELRGIHFAVDFLTANTRSLLDSRLEDGHYISARDKDVIVIGGGDTGTDCTGTSLRHGCRSVTQFEIMPSPSAERLPNNPWPEWPRIYRVDYGQEEAAARTGLDPRVYCLQTTRFVGDAEGRVREVHTAAVEWKREGARVVPVTIPGTERVWPAQLVLLAMGFLGPDDTLLAQLGVARDPRSNVQAADGAYATSLPGLFAAGDMRRGQSLVVWAINEGRGAARECDRYLMGETQLP